MTLTEELKDELHSRRLTENDFPKMARALTEFSETNEEARKIVKMLCDDDDSIIINVNLLPDEKYCFIAENGTFTMLIGEHRDDADGTVSWSKRAYFESTLLGIPQAKQMEMTGNGMKVYALAPLFNLWGRQMGGYAGMRDSRVENLEPVDMIAYHLENSLSIKDAVSGLVEGLRGKVDRINEIYLVRDKPLLHLFGPGALVKDETGGLIAMVPAPKGKENLVSSAKGAGGLHKIPFEGGKHGALDSLLSDLRPEYIIFRTFSWIGFCNKHDVVFDKNKKAMAKLVIDEGIREAIMSNPRETIEEKAGDIKVIVYVPVNE
ncbi:MAG: hypothetical protein ACFFCS_14865 [Candidatus Hodarchaeota archaeon]